MRFVDLMTAIRQNHALEHATLHVLGERNPSLSVAGRSDAAGFLIYGSVRTSDLEQAARAALDRLRRGEERLAVHPRCGTNLAVTSVMAGVAAFLATLGRPRSKLDRLPAAVTGATLAVIVAQPVAYRIQQRVTTTPHVEGLGIGPVTRRTYGRMQVHRVAVVRE